MSMEAPLDLTQFVDDRKFAYAVCAWLLWTQYRQLGQIIQILSRIAGKRSRKKKLGAEEP